MTLLHVLGQQCVTLIDLSHAKSKAANTELQRESLSLLRMLRHMVASRALLLLILDLSTMLPGSSQVCETSRYIEICDLSHG
jgi:hypothetical protein